MNDEGTKVAPARAEPDSVRPVPKVIRAASAIVVFALPLALATGAVAGYGLCQAFRTLKRLRHRA